MRLNYLQMSYNICRDGGYMIITKKRNYKKVITTLLVLLLVTSGAGAAAYWYLNNDTETENSSVIKEDDNQQIEKSVEETIVATATYTDITGATAFDLINTTDISVIDVSAAYDEGHLPGAANYYVGDGSLDTAIAKLNKDSEYLVYCHSDSASILGAQKMIDAGFKNVSRLVGNYGLWESTGYPVEIKFGGVGTYLGSVVATRSFLDGKFSHTLVVEGSEPAEGKFFEGWLTGSGGTISTGKLVAGTDRYTLTFTSTDDNRNLNNVVITEETEANGLDGISEEHIFEGSF